MSVHVSAYVWEHSQHKGAELLLMLAIADIAHKNGVAFPSVKTLAGYLRMSERQTQRLIQRCEASNELEVKRNAGPHGCHLFRVRLNLTLPLFSGGQPVEKPGDILSGDKMSGDKSAQKGVTFRASRGDIATSPEPKEQLLERKEGAACAARIPPGFQISDNVRAWAKRKGHEPYLQAHFEYFVLDAQSRSSAKYIDWDKALMKAISADWGNVRKQAEIKARLANGGVVPAAPEKSVVCAYCPRPWTSKPNGIPACDQHSHKAMFHEAVPKVPA